MMYCSPTVCTCSTQKKKKKENTSTCALCDVIKRCHEPDKGRAESGMVMSGE